LTEIWAQFHELNQIFLPKEKKFRISTGVTKDVDPYVTIRDRSEIQGRFQFEFGASILNTNKALATGAIQDMLGMLVNPLLFQLGIVGPDNIYTLLEDAIKLKGQDPEKYIKKPNNDPFFSGPKISAGDVIQTIMNGYFPYGQPMEDIQTHLSLIKDFVTDPANMKDFTPQQVSMLAQYTSQTIMAMQQEQAQQQMLANAAAMQQQVGGGKPGQRGAGQGKPGPPGQTAPPNLGVGGNPPVNGREALDESIPGAGGGGGGGAQ
jgi:hypothetical protein